MSEHEKEQSLLSESRISSTNQICENLSTQVSSLVRRLTAAGLDADLSLALTVIHIPLEPKPPRPEDAGDLFDLKR